MMRLNTRCVILFLAFRFLDVFSLRNLLPSSAQISHKSFKAPKRLPAFPTFDDAELEAARTLVADEVAALQLEVAQAAGGSLPEVEEVAALQVFIGHI